MSGNHEHRILLVDDEENILRSLRRLLRREGWKIDTCNSGASALELISETTRPFSLIISDQRMPEMSGSEFLEKASELMPDATRFLLTGYSDIRAVEDAVNKGKIRRYLTKPWDDEALLLHIRQAIEEVELRRENERLTRLTQKQNKQLYEIGLTLDKKVRKRTRELNEKSAALEVLNSKLERSFLTTVHLLISLIEAGNKILGGYLRQAGRLSKETAHRLGFEERQVMEIELAGLLHDIGLFGLPESFLQQPESEFSRADLRRFRQHPTYAAISLEAIEKLADSAKIVLHHHERYDGKGFPEGLKGEEIPMGARIISAVSDYCRVFHYWPKDMQAILNKAKECHGVVMNTSGAGGVDSMLQAAAEKVLTDGIRKKYDENVVTALIRITRELMVKSPGDQLRLVPLESLQPGMVIPQDLFLHDGRMLLAQSTVLDDTMVRAIMKLGKLKMVPESIAVAH